MLIFAWFVIQIKSIQTEENLFYSYPISRDNLKFDTNLGIEIGLCVSVET